MSIPDQQAAIRREFKRIYDAGFAAGVKSRPADTFSDSGEFDPEKIAALAERILAAVGEGEEVKKFSDYDEKAHPRDDRGRFVDKEEMEWAKTDPEIAAELRKSVTKPEERSKLEAMIDAKAVSPKVEPEPATKAAPARQVNTPNPKLPDASRPVLDHAELAAVDKYVDWDYDTLNSSLRKNGQPPEKQSETHAALQKAFEKTKTFKPPVTANRAMSLSKDALAGFIDGAKKAADAGKEFPMGGYISTTVDDKYKPDPAANVELQIKAIKGLDLRPHSKFGERENELLLNHGSKFRVTGVNQVGKHWVVQVEQVA